MSTTTKYSIKTLGVAGWVGSAVWDKVLKKLRLCSFRFNANGNFFKSRSNLESCFPELRSTFPLIAPVEVVHALHGQTTVSKAERRLWTFANNIFFQKSDWCFSFTLHLIDELNIGLIFFTGGIGVCVQFFLFCLSFLFYEGFPFLLFFFLWTFP